MKHLLLILLVTGYASPAAFAQVRGDEKVKVYLEAGYKTGKLTETYNTIPLSANYASPVNASESKMKFNATNSAGYNAQIGYYLDNRQHFALQAGVLYFKQQGTLDVADFHVEYKAQDYKGSIFRQVVTADDGLHEDVTSQHISIPVMLRYNVWLSDRVSVNLDAGILYDTWLKNNYTSKASFDYEAIYQFAGTGSNITSSYDNNPNPAPQDWLITREEFMKDNPKGNLQDYFSSLKKTGYNVGLNQPITKKSGEVNFQKKTIGYMGQLELGFLLTKNLVLKAGAFYSSESFSGKPKTNAMLTSKPGEYNPLLNYTNDVTIINYGLTVGFAYNFYSYATMKFRRN